MGGNRLIFWGLCDSICNCYNCIQNPIVPEPQHPKALGFQPGGPLGIVVSLLRVMPAIHLDDGPLLEAHEVDEIWACWEPAYGICDR